MLLYSQFRFAGHYLLCLGACFMLMLLFACTGTTTAPAKPTVMIASPPSGSVYTEEETVAVQSSAADVSGIVKVELVADGMLVRVDPVPVSQGQSQFSVIQNWTAKGVGSHTLTVRAYNTQGVFAEAGIIVSVTAKPMIEATLVPTLPPLPTLALPPTAPPTAVPPTVAPTDVPTLPPLPTAPPTNLAPTATLTNPPPSATTCLNDAQFIADVTIPDNTRFNPLTPFGKTWRVRNSGGCAWGAAYTIAFVNGANLAGFTQNIIPPTAPGATVDITIPMTAPAREGTYTSNWRVRDANGNFFGTTLSVVIVVGSPTAAPTITLTPTQTTVPATAAPSCAGTPNNFSFSAARTFINKGESAMLSWGAITNADGAFLDGEGVATPGSRRVTPDETTTYTLVATCGGQSRTKQVTITVIIWIVP